MSGQTKKYVVKSPVFHQGAPYEVDRTIELTAEEAESVGSAVELQDTESKFSVNKTQIAKKPDA